MDELISPPKQIQITEGKDHTTTVVIEPCYPGYGTTLGNALRRVMLSSMPGAAIVAIQIKGVDHEFSTLAGVKEDIVEIMLNVKNVHVKLHSDEQVTFSLKVKGQKVVTAKDFDVPSSVEITNPDAVIATLTDKNAAIDMTCIAQKGKGYVPSELLTDIKTDIGTILLDAIYTPIKNVNYSVEHVRVGEITNFDKLTMTIVTNGAISGSEAFHLSSQILVNHFSLFSDQVKPEKKHKSDLKKEPKKKVTKE